MGRQSLQAPVNQMANVAAARTLHINIGRNVRRLRQAAAISIDECADELGASAEELSDHEAGKSRFERGQLLALSGLFSVPLSDLTRNMVGRRRAPSTFKRISAQYRPQP